MSDAGAARLQSAAGHAAFTVTLCAVIVGAAVISDTRRANAPPAAAPVAAPSDAASSTPEVSPSPAAQTSASPSAVPVTTRAPRPSASHPPLHPDLADVWMPEGFVLTSQQADRSCDSGCAVRRKYRVTLPFAEAVRAGTDALRSAGLEPGEVEPADTDIDGEELTGGRTGQLVPVEGAHPVGDVIGGLVVIEDRAGRVTAQVGLATWTVARHVRELRTALDELRLDRLGRTETREEGSSVGFSDGLSVIRVITTDLTREEGYAHAVAALKRAGFTLAGRVCREKWGGPREETWVRDGVMIEVLAAGLVIRLSASHDIPYDLEIC